MNRGLLYGIVAYLLWGLFPVYWKLLDHIPPGEILANRIVWSFVFLVILLGLRRQWTWVRALRRDRKTIGTLVAAGGLLAVNWFTYIWGVNNGYIVETSLGYFINPMVSVLLGVLVLGERLRRVQKFAVAVAALGVIYLTVGYGSLPWIALTLAFSFGFYGLLKKRTPLGAAESLTGEMMVLLIPALLYMFSPGINGTALLRDGDLSTHLLLIGSGVVTAVPLLFFAAAAHRIPLSSLGLLQYIAPTLQLLIGVFVYQESFNTARLIGFVTIWLALLIFTVDNLLHRQEGADVAAVGK